MKHKIMLGLVIILLCVTVSAEMYYQETAATYELGSRWTNPTFINDTNYDTCAITKPGLPLGSLNITYNNVPTDNAYLYINYSKDDKNLSLANCQDGPLSLQINTTNLGGFFINVYCYNGTKFTNLLTDFSNGYLCEEALQININYSGVVDNCSVNNFTAINFSLLDSSNNALKGSFAGHIELNNGYKFNLTYNNSEYFETCIRYNFMSLVANGQFEYSAPGYDAESYYFIGTTLDNSTNNIKLYLNDENSTSTVTFTVNDENDNPVENVLINVMEYDLATDSATSTEIVKTNSNGVANANAILFTQRYKFILMIGSQVYLETSDLYLTGTSYGFRINLGENFYDSFAVVQGVSCLTTFDNSTGTFEFVWSDPTATTSKGCLEVTKTIPLGTTSVFDGCLSSYGGTLSHNVSASDGNVSYVGQGSIYLNGQKYICGDSVSFSYDTTYKKYGKMGAFATFLIILVVVLAGLWHPGVAVGLGAVVIMLSVWMKFIYLGWGTLAGVLIIALLTIYRLNK